MKTSKGFTLVSILMVSFFLSALGLLLTIQMLEEWEMTADLEAQLHSLVMAENGIEYARAILPALEINPLLVGLDGVVQAQRSAEWRNPVPLAYARRVPPQHWKLEVDDGLPFHGGKLLLPQGYRSAAGGYFFIRFSNNPEETAEEDLDRIVVVRSLGVVESSFKSLLVPELRNAVTLLEATLRQERTFDLPSPVTLLGKEGVFSWKGSSFRIFGAEAAAVSIIQLEDSSLKEQLEASLDEDQEICLTGAGAIPSIQDISAAWHSEPSYRRSLQPLFWNHLLDHLPTFSDPDAGFLFLPQGGVFEGHFEGILAAVGDLTLHGEARIEGLLLHFGSGQLTLEGRAQVRGGIWLSNLEAGRESLISRPLRFLVRQEAQVIYDRDRITAALARLPPTLLGWRILTPEMNL